MLAPVDEAGGGLALFAANKAVERAAPVQTLGPGLVEELLQPVLLLLGQFRDEVGPAAVGRLPRHESEGDAADDLAIRGIAQAIEEEQGQGKFVGYLARGDEPDVIADELGGLLHAGSSGGAPHSSSVSAGKAA